MPNKIQPRFGPATGILFQVPISDCSKPWDQSDAVKHGIFSEVKTCEKTWVKSRGVCPSFRLLLLLCLFWGVKGGIFRNIKFANDNFPKHFDETSKKLTDWHQNDQPFRVVSMYSNET